MAALSDTSDVVSLAHTRLKLILYLCLYPPFPLEAELVPKLELELELVLGLVLGLELALGLFASNVAPGSILREKPQWWQQ